MHDKNAINISIMISVKKMNVIITVCHTFYIKKRQNLLIKGDIYHLCFHKMRWHHSKIFLDIIVFIKIYVCKTLILGQSYLEQSF
jgi:hypothetical protein